MKDYSKKLEEYKNKQLYLQQKEELKHSLPSSWGKTMTKKIVWIAIMITVVLWLFDLAFIFLASPLFLSLPETTVNEFTTACKSVTVGLFATIVFYFIRAFMDSWSIAKTGIDVTEQQLNKEQIINDVKEMAENIKYV